MFGINAPNNYPVYKQDSLINSNVSFDDSGFKQLESLIKSGETLSLFPFTFSEPGIYLFEDNADSDQQLIIGVMDMG